MNTKITNGVKTSYAKYGLKPKSIEELANIVEQRLIAMGAKIDDADFDTKLQSELVSVEPFIKVIQTDVDARVKGLITPPVKPIDDVTPPDNSALAEVLKAMQDMRAEMATLSQKRAEDEKRAKLAERDNKVKELLKGAGATDEPVLDIVLKLNSYDEKLSAEDVVKIAEVDYSNQLKQIRGAGFVPQTPETGKAQADAAKAKAQAIIDKEKAKSGAFIPQQKT